MKLRTLALTTALLVAGCNHPPPYWMRNYDRNGQYVGKYETYDHDRARTIQALPLDFKAYPLLGRKIDVNDYYSALVKACDLIDPTHTKFGTGNPHILTVHPEQLCIDHFLKVQNKDRDKLSLE
jgi:hypothetical protein